MLALAGSRLLYNIDGRVTELTVDTLRPLDAPQMAAKLGCSVEAIELARDAEFIDLHIDTLIPWRLWGYDIFRRNRSPFAGRFFGHLDMPRIGDAGLSGAMWSITTNIMRGASGRWRTFQRNLDSFRQMVESSKGGLAFVRNRTEYDQARRAGAHAVLLAIQGGNALESAPDGPASVPDGLLTRVTLVHLTNSCFGASSSPIHLFRRNKGLTDRGRLLVEQLNAERVFVDLAHIHPKGFWDAVDVHDPTQPLLVTHTGVDGVCPHWRNLDDAQIRKVAETGGVVGIMAHSGFLRRRGGPRDGSMLVEHMEHVIDVAGEDGIALGTDYDGLITPPTDLRSGDHYPLLVQHMLQRGWSEARIRKVLGENFLRCLGDLRP